MRRGEDVGGEVAHFIPIGVAECRLMVKDNLWLRVMDQETRWLTRYKEVMDFMEANKRRPSKYEPEERKSWNWLRHNQKVYSKGMLRPEREARFKELLELMEENRHLNQYV